MVLGSEYARPAIIREKNTPMDSAVPEFWNVERIPDATPRWSGGTLPMIADVFGAENIPCPIPLSNSRPRELGVGEVHRDQQQTDERDGHDEQSGRGEQPGAEPVRKEPGHRAGDQEAHGEREHEDAGPQRRPVEAVAVQRQPDALQPDDQHELEATASDRRQQRGEVPGGEGTDAEQPEPEHRLGDPVLGDTEHDEQRDPGRQAGDDARVGPTRRVTP